jgi:hypothetical protein
METEKTEIFASYIIFFFKCLLCLLVVVSVISFSYGYEIASGIFSFISASLIGFMLYISFEFRNDEPFSQRLYSNMKYVIYALYCILCVVTPLAIANLLYGSVVTSALFFLVSAVLLSDIAYSSSKLDGHEYNQMRQK